MSEAPRGNLTFVAVAREADRTILASCSHGASIELEGVKKLLSPEQMRQVKVALPPMFPLRQPGMHYSFAAGESTWHLMQHSG